MLAWLKRVQTWWQGFRYAARSGYLRTGAKGVTGRVYEPRGIPIGAKGTATLKMVVKRADGTEQTIHVSDVEVTKMEQ